MKQYVSLINQNWNIHNSLWRRDQFRYWRNDSNTDQFFGDDLNYNYEELREAGVLTTTEDDLRFIEDKAKQNKETNKYWIKRCLLSYNCLPLGPPGPVGQSLTD